MAAAEAIKTKEDTPKPEPKKKVLSEKEETPSEPVKKSKPRDPLTVRKGRAEKDDTLFTYKAEDGSIISVPMVGKVNCIELQQEDRTDWLFTRLPKELALQFAPGKVRTRYTPEAKGNRCVIVSKYRGDAIDANKPKQVGECYTLIFTSHYAAKNAKLEHVEEGLTDTDLKKALFALDESKALRFKNKWLNERELRKQEQDYREGQEFDYRKSVTRTTAKVVDDIDIGETSVKRSVGGTMSNLIDWVTENWLWVLILGGGALLVLSMFTGGGG